MHAEGRARFLERFDSPVCPPSQTYVPVQRRIGAHQSYLEIYGRAGALKDSRMGGTRSRTLAKRQPSARATIFRSASDKGRSRRRRRSERTIARNRSHESSSLSLIST